MLNSNPMSPPEIYATNADGYICCPTNIAQGVRPLDSLPAQWWNCLWHQTTQLEAQASQGLSDLYNQVSCVVTAAGVDKQESCSDELYRSILCLNPKIATTATPGLVKSSTEDFNLYVDSATGLAVPSNMGCYCYMTKLQDALPISYPDIYGSGPGLSQPPQFCEVSQSINNLMFNTFYVCEKIRQDIGNMSCLNVLGNDNLVAAINDTYVCATVGGQVSTRVGDLADLTTTDKTSIVAAINEVAHATLPEGHSLVCSYCGDYKYGAVGWCYVALNCISPAKYYFCSLIELAPSTSRCSMLSLSGCYRCCSTDYCRQYGASIDLGSSYNISTIMPHVINMCTFGAVGSNIVCRMGNICLHTGNFAVYSDNVFISANCTSATFRSTGKGCGIRLLGSIASNGCVYMALDCALPHSLIIGPNYDYGFHCLMKQPAAIDSVAASMQLNGLLFSLAVKCNCMTQDMLFRILQNYIPSGACQVIVGYYGIRAIGMMCRAGSTISFYGYTYSSTHFQANHGCECYIQCNFGMTFMPIATEWV